VASGSKFQINFAVKIAAPYAILENGSENVV